MIRIISTRWQRERERASERERERERETGGGRRKGRIGAISPISRSG